MPTLYMNSTDSVDLYRKASGVNTNQPTKMNGVSR